MVDPEIFMQNSPFLRAGPTFNLANTTPDLLKFQLQEQNRLHSKLDALAPLLMEAKFAGHLAAALESNVVSVDDSVSQSGSDSFSAASGASLPASAVLELLSGFDAPNHLNLKVLIENSVFDVSKVGSHTVLSLNKVKRLKARIADQRGHRAYLQQRLSAANAFCTTLLVGPAAPPRDVDPALLVKVMRQNAALEQEYIAATTELEDLETQLKNHNLACLVLGYVEDVKLAAPHEETHLPTPTSTADESHRRLFEALFSHIASLAAQKGVNLPVFEGKTAAADDKLASDAKSAMLDAKIHWAQQCIDALSAAPLLVTTSLSLTAILSSGTAADLRDTSVLQDHSFLAASPYKNIKAPNERTIAEYKVALDDLRFSHQYFMKEYDYLKENALKTILEYRKKNAALEREVAAIRLSPSHPSVGSLKEADAKDQEISRLRKEISLLKIDHIGDKSPRSSTISSPSLFIGEGEEEESVFRPAKPSTSTGILRKEFRKIVSEIQDRHEVELAEERQLRRQLEKRLEEKS